MQQNGAKVTRNATFVTRVMTRAILEHLPGTNGRERRADGAGVVKKKSPGVTGMSLKENLASTSF
jgi:hypothetical protein